MGAQRREWRDATCQYASNVNAYVDVGLRDGWEAAGDPPQPPDLKAVAPIALAAVRKANRRGQYAEFRELWPPNHEAFSAILDRVGQCVPFVTILDDDAVVARIGAPYEQGYVVKVTDSAVEPVRDCEFVGRSSCRRYFAVGRAQGIAVTDGWQGPVVMDCAWPAGNEGAPASIEPLSEPPAPTRLEPFDGGQKVLLVSAAGIFVVSSSTAVRLLPACGDLEEDETEIRLYMEHGTVSPDGRLIAVGSQDSNHLVFDSHLQLVADVGPMSSYPHYAAFSADSRFCIFNSCHFYNGVTIGCETDRFGSMQTAPFEEDRRTPILEGDARVYAAVARGDSFIVGDAYGYLRAFDRTGKRLWQHFLGSTIGDMDITPDGKTLVATSYAGYISVIDLDTGARQPYQIGTGNHEERYRWLFWKDEPRPLRW